jgi:hypothetical protein
MGNDGMALLVVIGLGGLVLWYLMHEKEEIPATTQGQPCTVGGAYGGVGLTASCGAVEKGYKFVKDKVEEILPYTPVGIVGGVVKDFVKGSEYKINGKEVSKAEFIARTGCTGDVMKDVRSGCLGKAAENLNSEPQTRNGPLNLKIGKAPSLGPVVNVPPGPPKPPPASKPMGFR